MPVAGGVALGSLPEAGRGQRRGSCDHDADRSAVSGSALLRLAADDGVAGNPGPCRQSQTDPAPDAAAGVDGDLSAPEHEQTGSGAQNLSVPPWRDRDRAGQSGVVLGRYLHPDDWVSRAVLAWRLSNSLGADFCVDALEEALARYGRPEIFNTDQG